MEEMEYAKKAAAHHQEQKAGEKQLVKWATHEVGLAKKRHEQCQGEAGFKPEVYDAALDCLQRMEQVDLIGYNLQTTLGLISSMVDRLPLTPIDNIFRDWEATSYAENTFFNRRCESLLKIVDKDVKRYTDVSRVEVIDADHEYTDEESGNNNPSFDPARWLIDKLYPIEFPYHPQTYKVFIDRSTIDQNKFTVKGIVTHQGELVLDHNGIYEIDHKTQSVTLTTETVVRRKVVAVVGWPAESDQWWFGDANTELVKGGAFPLLPLYYIPDDVERTPEVVEPVLNMYRQIIDMSDSIKVITIVDDKWYPLIQYAQRQGKEVDMGGGNLEWLD